MDERRQASDDVTSRADFILWAMGILLALGVLWLDPFGFSTHAAQLSDQVLNRIIGDRLLGRTSGNDSPITVVLVLDTDAQLAGPGEAETQATPILPLAFHAQLLDRLFAYEPAAVFLDYRFLLDRSDETIGLDALREVACEYAPGAPECNAPEDGRQRDTPEQGRHTPLFVVVAPEVLPPDGMHDAVAEALSPLRNEAYEAYVVADQDLRAGDRHLYPLAHNLPVVGGRAPVRLSPAFAIYRELCRHAPSYLNAPEALEDLAKKPPDKEPPKLCGDETDWTDPASAVRIIWGSSIAEPQKSWQRCHEMPWSAVLWHSAFGDAWETRLDCGHQPTLSAAEILTSSESWQADPCTQAGNEKSLARWLCGRVVMIGPLSRTLPDFVLPTTSKPLPGVYWHAMALDNLLAFDDGYKRDVYELTTGMSVPNSLLALAVFLIMAGVAHVLGHVARWIRLRIESFGAFVHILCNLSVMLVFVSIHFLVAFGTSWFAFEHMNLAPVNWLGVFVTGVTLPPVVLALFRARSMNVGGRFLRSSG